MDLHTFYSEVTFRMILSDLTKDSMTQSVAPSLHDSQASCFYIGFGYSVTFIRPYFVLIIRGVCFNVLTFLVYIFTASVVNC